MFKLVLVLSFAAIFCECGLVRKDLLSKRSDDCSGLRACPYPTFKTPNTDELYDRFCQEYQHYNSCYEANIAQCNNKTEQQRRQARLEVAKIICTPEGKDITFATAGVTTCVGDTAELQEAKRRITHCREVFDREYSAAYDSPISDEEWFLVRCTLLHTEIKCEINAFDINCGTIIGTYTNMTYRASFKPILLERSCALSY